MRGFVVLLFLLLLFFSCSKEQPNIPSVISPDPVDTTVVPIDTIGHIIKFGTSSILKNGTKWEPPVAARFFPGRLDDFYLYYKLELPNLRSESFSLYDISCKPGKYQIGPFTYWNDLNFIPQGLFGISQDLDQVIGLYYVDTTRSANFIEIIRYDSTTHIVEGRFQVFMGKDVTSNPWNVPDSIFLTDGKFHLKIEE